MCQGTVQFKEQTLNDGHIPKKHHHKDVEVKREFDFDMREGMCDSMHYGEHDLVD